MHNEASHTCSKPTRPSGRTKEIQMNEVELIAILRQCQHKQVMNDYMRQLANIIIWRLK
jgi:hypothetical protein